MKQSLIKKLSYITVCTMLAGAVGATAAYAVNENTGAGEAPKTEETVESEKEEETVTKDETVYVLADANGARKKTIVSDHLKNPDGSGIISEVSDLRDVRNVNGDETFTESGDERTWAANGNDIYYQGTSNDSLPVDITVKYTLDGREISPAELAGKSGRVTIRFDYTNNESEEKMINGGNEKIYVPFAAVTGMMLDNEKFRNIEVTNGKTVNDGTRTVVIGTAFPGLAESLGIADSEKIEIPSYVEVTADVTDFGLANTFTMITNEVFNDIDIDLGDETADITADIDRLGDAMKQIMDGADALHGGLTELLEKSGELSAGVGQLNDGAAMLSDGAASANSGAAQLYDGSVKLSAGLDTLTASSAELTAGSEQVFNSLLDMADAQLAAAGMDGYKLTIDNYSETLDKIIASIGGDNTAAFAEKTAKEQVTAAVEAKRDLIEAEVTKGVAAQVQEKVNEGVKAKVLEAVLASQGLTPDTYEQGIAAGMIDEAAQTAISGAVDAQMQTDEVKSQAAAALEQQLASEEVKAIIAQTTEAKIAGLIEENYNSEEVQAQIAEGAKAAEEGIAKLETLKAQLDGYNTFYTGLLRYTDGVASAADGAKQIKGGLGELSDGTKQLADGAKQLADGTSELSANMPALIDGVTQLADGSGELSDGCVKFNDEGISKIISLAEGTEEI